MQRFVLVALLLALPASAKPWHGIEPGVSTRDAVIEKLGAPSRTSTAQGKEILAWLDKEAIKGTTQVQIRIDPARKLVERIDVFPGARIDRDAVETSYGPKCPPAGPAPASPCYLDKLNDEGNRYFLFPTLGLAVFFEEDAKTVHTLVFTASASGGAAPVAEKTPPPAAPPAPAAPVELRKLKADGFTVMFPGDPQPMRSEITLKDGKVKTASWNVSAADGAIYSISTAEYPAKLIASRSAAALLDEGKQGLVNQLKGTVQSAKDRTLQGHPGKAVTISSSSGEVRARFFLVGPVLYTLLVLGGSGAGAEEFLTSLELVKPTKAP